MAQHSKDQGAQDAKRAASFTKIAKEMIVAVKEGGSADPANNSRLATVITKARAANMPNDNIKRVLEKPPAQAAARTTRASPTRATARGAWPFWWRL